MQSIQLIRLCIYGQLNLYIYYLAAGLFNFSMLYIIVLPEIKESTTFLARSGF